ncbi:MAG: hypothetical protein A2Z25_02510 [Planctomycetes bacterium RBG_16_55_9]|nr:MAG: hypothetical protein A2Z25_02510 [Planctomycetes bacterium RBG_16_55_9]
MITGGSLKLEIHIEDFKLGDDLDYTINLLKRRPMILSTVFLEGYYKFLVMLHLLATFVLVGAMTHNLLIVLNYGRGKFGKKKLEHFYVKVSLWAYLIVYVFGTLAYPAFSINTRASLFDKTIPWATGLFEVKEHWAALGLAFIVVYYLLRKSFQPDEERHKLFFYVPLCLLLNLILWYKVVVGCYLALLRGIPQ